MISAAVTAKKRKERKKTSPRWFERFGPSPELHGAVAPQKPGIPPSAGLASPCLGQPSSKQPYVYQPK